MARTTLRFEFNGKATEIEELQHQFYDEVNKRKKAVCEELKASIYDFHWSQYDIFDFDNHATVFLSYRRRSDFNELTADELANKLSELKEELVLAIEEFEEIEDLDEEDYNDYGFNSEEEYKEKSQELDANIFILNSDIDLIEDILKEKSQ